MEINNWYYFISFERKYDFYLCRQIDGDITYLRMHIAGFLSCLCNIMHRLIYSLARLLFIPHITMLLQIFDSIADNCWMSRNNHVIK